MSKAGSLAYVGVLAITSGCGGGVTPSSSSAPSDSPDSGATVAAGDAGAPPSSSRDGGPAPTLDSGRMPGDASPPPSGSACTGKVAQAPGNSTWTISTATGSRSALVHVPKGYDASNATPLVLNFHGYGGSPVQEEGLTLMDAESDAQGFVLVYPQGTGAIPSWNAGACCGTAVSSNLDDVGFVSSLL